MRSSENLLAILKAWSSILVS